MRWSRGRRGARAGTPPHPRNFAHPEAPVLSPSGPSAWLRALTRSRHALSWSQKMREKGRKRLGTVLPLYLTAPTGAKVSAGPTGHRNWARSLGRGMLVPRGCWYLGMLIPRRCWYPGTFWYPGTCWYPQTCWYQGMLLPGDTLVPVGCWYPGDAGSQGLMVLRACWYQGMLVPRDMLVLGDADTQEMLVPRACWYPGSRWYPGRC